MNFEKFLLGIGFLLFISFIYYYLYNKKRKPEVIKKHINNLISKDPKTVTKAQKSLIAIENFSLFYLIEALKDKNSEIQEASKKLIKKIGPSSIDYLVAALEIDNKSTIKNTSELLIQFNKDSIKALVKSLNEVKTPTKIKICNILGKIGSSASSTLIKALDHENDEVKIAACNALKNIDDPIIIDPIISQLSSKNNKVRLVCLDTLSNKKNPRASKAIISLLKDPDSQVNQKAIEAVLKLGDSCLDYLINNIHDEDWKIRKSCCILLGKIGNTQGVDPLIKRLEDWNKDVTIAACEALGNIGDSKAVKPIIKKMGDFNEDVRSAAYNNLGKVGKISLDDLIIALKHEDWHVREGACKALEIIEDSKAQEPLFNMLKDPDSCVRAASCKALKKMWKPKYTKKLISLLKDKEANVRLAACEVIQYNKIKEASEILLEVLLDENKQVRQKAKETLEALSKKNIASNIELILEGNQEKAILLSKADENEKKRYINPFLKALKDENDNTRRWACYALGHLMIKNKTIIDNLIEALGDKIDKVREEAAAALEKLGEKKIAFAIIGSLKNNKEALNEISELTQKNDLRCLNPLNLLIKIKKDEIRINACRGISMIKNLNVIPILVDLLGDDNPSIKKIAYESINNIYKNIKPIISTFVCRRDMTRFKLLEIPVENIGIAKYPACRKCHKTDDALWRIKEIILVLDKNLEKSTDICNGKIRKSWFVGDELFDFDKVEIISADEEEIKKFCRMVDDDIDPIRAEKYNHIKCEINKSLKIPEKRIKTLKRIFKEINFV